MTQHFYAGGVKSKLKSGVDLKEKSLQEIQGHRTGLPWEKMGVFGIAPSMAAAVQCPK